MDEKVPDWKDHKACWNFEYRGSLGESLLHVLIVCNSSVHSKIARMLILAFPNLALDVVEGNEFRGKILIKLFKIQKIINYNFNYLLRGECTSLGYRLQ